MAKKAGPPPVVPLSPRLRIAFWVFALLGLGASASSAWVHFQLLRSPGYTSFCDISTTWNCANAYQSAYGYLLGVPVAVFGVLWFVAVVGLLLAERNGSPHVRESVPGYILALSVVGLAFVLHLGYGAFFVIRTLCLLCLVTYVAVIGLFVGSAMATPFPMATLPSRALRDARALGTPAALAFLFVLVVGAATAVAWFPKGSASVAELAAGVASGPRTDPNPAATLPQDQRAEVERWFDSQPRSIVPVDGQGASVVIVKFNDHQCPPCGSTHHAYKPILARYEAEHPGRVKFVNKDYPIDPACNAGTPGGTHRGACAAAVAARLADEKGQRERMDDWLFANQATLTPAGIKQALAEIAGRSDFDERYPVVVEQVKADIALGGLLRVGATPTFFINGVKIEGGLQPPFFDAIIGYELRKAGATR
jgi:uncharacterized membrane protein/protein-disulfide isomerase